MTHLEGITASAKSTGWRDFSEFLTGDWELHPAAGACRFLREGNLVRVILRLRRTTPGGSRGSVEKVLSLPAGWAAISFTPIAPATLGNTPGYVGTVSSASTIDTQAPSVTATWSAGDVLYASGSYDIAQPFPAATALPGTQITPPNYT